MNTNSNNQTENLAKPVLADGLSWNDALYAMHEGKTVKHRYFSDKEQIFMEDGRIVLDGKYHVTVSEFIKYRNNPTFLDSGWTIVE